MHPALLHPTPWCCCRGIPTDDPLYLPVAKWVKLYLGWGWCLFLVKVMKVLLRYCSTWSARQCGKKKEGRLASCCYHLWPLSVEVVSWRFPCPGELFVFGEAGVLFWNLNLIFHRWIGKTGERKIKADQADATATWFETVAHFTPDLLCTGLKQVRNMFPLHILHLICMSHLHMIRIYYRVHHTFSKLYRLTLLRHLPGTKQHDYQTPATDTSMDPKVMRLVLRELRRAELKKLPELWVRRLRKVQGWGFLKSLLFLYRWKRSWKGLPFHQNWIET